MKKTITCFLLAAMCSASCVSCGKNNEPANTDEAKTGFVTGKVTNTQGQPVANAQVYISSTIFFNSGVQTTTDANGNYKIAIPAVNSFRAFARMLVQYNGHPYLVYFEPDHPQSFTYQDKVTCNFKWKLQGAVPASSAPDDYYGGTVSIYSDASNLPFPPGDLAVQGNIIFKFEPVGPMIDGSAGQTITAHTAAPNYSYMYDIPVGKYKVSATYLGQTLKLRDNRRGSNDSFGTEKVVEFIQEGSTTNGGEIRMYLEFSK
ncbi:carboxypeptidase-like regulatory domain-containing protein [Ferruginibacter sp.]